MGKFIVSGSKSGQVTYVNPDGEIVRELSLPPGVYDTATFLKLALAGESVAFDRPVVVARGNMRTCKPDGQFDSAANPHFRVTAAMRQERNIRAMLTRTEALAVRVRSEVKALRRAKAAPQLVAPASDEVVAGSDSSDAS